MIYLPILAAVALAGGTIFEKEILKRKRMDVKRYQSLEFLATVIAMLPFIYFFWKIDPKALELKNILIFAGVIISALVANLFYFHSLKGDKVSNLEPAFMLQPLFTILLALFFNLFFTGLYENNTRVVVPALIAGIALIASHVKKEHLNLNKYFISAIIGSFFFALELTISLLILNFYSSITFYFIRCAAVFLITIFIFRPKLSGFKSKFKWTMLFVGFIWVVNRLATYYGYIKIGIISTTLVLMLGTIFIYVFARIFLKEKITKRNIIASVIILACILYSMF